MPASASTIVRPTEKTGRPEETKDFYLPGLQTKVLGEGEGVVQAIVAVTGNVDDGGDIIEPGAFVIDRHPKCVWSHDLNRLVGKVIKAEEWAPGDPRLPADLLNRKLGALVFDVQFDLADPESHSAYRKVIFHEDLGWSIGYSILAGGATTDKEGRRHLTKIVVWEASPTTFGMNREARTVAVKSLVQESVENLGLSEEKAQAVKDLIATLVAPEEKAFAPIQGTFEEIQNGLREALEAWGVEERGARDAENDWWISLEGTFEDNVIATLRVYGEDGGTTTYRFPYTATDEGDYVLGDPEEVEIAAVVTPAGEGGTEATEEDDEGGTGASDEEASLAAIEPKDLAEALDEVKKGRVLSERNATALRQAAEAIAAVLAAAEKEAEDEKDKAKDGKRQVVDATKGTGPNEPDPDEEEPVEEEKAVVLGEADLLEMMALAES